MAANNEWNWSLLGQEIEHYVDQVKRNTTRQYPWTHLAYLAYLTGAEQTAHFCLQKSYKFAEPGPNHPGCSHRRVEGAIKSNSFLTGGMVTRPPKPDWFMERYDSLLNLYFLDTSTMCKCIELSTT